MAGEKAINFAALATGTELETPMGTGKFLSYKKGNFKKQHVQVEDAHGKQKWYTEEVLRLANTGRSMATTAGREADKPVLNPDFYYYAL